MQIIGLTGSIAMGKTTAAQAFSALGIPVFDSDAAVHQLYAKGGKGVSAIGTLVPEAIQSGSVDRQILSKAISSNPGLLVEIERVIHPLVREAQENFLKEARAANSDFAVMDIPLLFETGRDKEFDFIVVVSAPEAVQHARALARPGMTVEKLSRLLARQMPDAEKRARAHFVVDTSGSPESAAAQIRDIVVRLRGRKADA